jgi:polyhydroxyalkanoate synthesis regulator phasin
MRGLKLIRWGSLAAILVITLVAIAPAFAQDSAFTNEVAVLPQALERISWGAILAGAVVALMVQLTLNLLAVAIGASTLNPAEEDSASVADVGRNTVISMALIMLGSLFLGGWMAARFAGTPVRLDGLLHGLIVWGLVTLATMILLTTTLGRLFSGLNRMLQTAIRLAGSTASTAASAVGSVARSAAHTASDVAQRAAEGIEQTAQTAAYQAQMGEGEVGAAYQRIQREANEIIARTGVNQQQVANAAREAVQDVRAAVSEAQQHPEDLQRIVANTLGRLFNRGREVVSQVDRDAVVDLLVQRGNMSREQAQAQVARWEQQLNDIPRRTGDALNEVRERSDEMMHDPQRAQAMVSEGAARAQHAVGEEVRRVQNAVSEGVSKVQYEVERTAREAAQTATDTLAKLAMAAFVIVLIGALAAGFGGFIGAPQELPVAEVNTSAELPVGDIAPTANPDVVIPTLAPDVVLPTPVGGEVIAPTVGP